MSDGCCRDEADDDSIGADAVTAFALLLRAVEFDPAFESDGSCRDQEEDGANGADAVVTAFALLFPTVAANAAFALHPVGGRPEAEDGRAGSMDAVAAFATLPWTVE